MKITITNDGKEKDQSFEATVEFDYVWDNSWLGYGGQMSLTAFGSNQKEAEDRLIEELFRYQSELVKVISSLKS
jgi:hypothetical protein